MYLYQTLAELYKRYGRLEDASKMERELMKASDDVWSSVDMALSKVGGGLRPGPGLTGPKSPACCTSLLNKSQIAHSMCLVLQLGD